MRFVAIAILILHFLINLVHAFLIYLRKVLTNQMLHRILVITGIALWIFIDLWIVYLYYTWVSQFTTASWIPEFPEELITFLIISISMLALLVFELITPWQKFFNDSGYAPASQSDDPYNTRVMNVYNA